MAIKIKYSQRFVKDLRKAPKNIQLAFRNRLETFLSDRYHPLQNNHSLSGKYQSYHSINITGDWRALFEEEDGGKNIYFVTLGTHSQLYK